METLQQYVDSLFRKYRGSHQVEELKLEVLSNLEARVHDLTSQGMPLEEAVRQAKCNITSVDHLIEDEHTVYRHPFILEYVQLTLLYSVTAWIITLPLLFAGSVILVNRLFMIITIGLGILYFVLYSKRHSSLMQHTSVMNLRSAMKLRTIGWILWSIYILATTLLTTAIQFGSNIWFGRAVHIDGPYQFAMICIPYLTPLITIVIPLLLHAAPKLILKYKTDGGDPHEETA